MKTLEFLSHLNSLDIKIWLEKDKLKYQAPKGAMTAEIKQKIGARKAEILAFLSAAKTSSDRLDSKIIPVPRDQVLPLSFAQQRLWFLHQLSPNSQSYNLLEAMRLEGELDRVALEKSLSELLRRHEILRSTFPMVDGQPIQDIAAPSPVHLPCHDLQSLSSEEQTTKFQEIAIATAQESFDLAQGSLIQFMLFQLGDQEHILLIKMHHIIYDGWSLSIFFRELSQLYQAFTQGLPSPLPELSIQYADFAVWQRQWLTGEVLEQQLNYWREQLADAPLVLELKTDHPRPSVQTFHGDGQGFRLEQDLSQQIKQLSQESETTLFMTLLAAFFILLSRYSGQEDLLVGTPIANRNNSAIEDMMGFFANTLALRGDLSENPTFLELLARVKRTTLSAYAHQDFPFEMLVDKIQPERDLSRNPVIQVLFSAQNTPPVDSSLSGLKIENMPLSTEIKARFDLEVGFWETSEGLEGVWVHNTDLFEPATITRMGNHFHNLIKAIVANPNERIGKLSLLSPEEHDQLITEWNATQADYPQDECIHQLFEKQVAINPDAVAVVFGEQSLTYRELNCQANQLAHYLLTLGVTPDTLVGICVERSLIMIMGLLAIIKAGGAYVPLDPEYPQERLSWILEDTQVALLLTQTSLGNKLPPHQAKLVFLDDLDSQIAQHPEDNPHTAVNPSHLANVIYTSGSTGKPKGVMVEHKGLYNLAMDQIEVFGIQSDSRVLQFASFSFDACLGEILLSLGSGASLYLGSKDSLLPGKPLIEQIENNRITHAILPPPALAVLPQKKLPDLKTMVVGGEACSLELVKQWSPGRNFFNGYGPTEASVCSTISRCYPDDTKVTIGQPISNVQVYILDSYLQPVPIGVAGELHIGGIGLARGYLNRAELTQEKFIPNPFEPAGESKLYKTGDLARYLPDGKIEFLGRIDHQVKIRGFRIELGEIETALSQHKDVKVSAVIVREDTPGDKRLVAYIVPSTEVTPNISELYQFLKAKLPDYMVPSGFDILESLPLTPNGKVDLRALKAPTHFVDQGRFVRARNQLEYKLVQIWLEILNLERIGVRDNFFALGGHSLLVPYLMTKIKQEFGIDFPLTTLFNHPTIEELASLIQEGAEEVHDSRIVAIQPQGSQTPFFCVPGIGGKPFYFYDLGRYLGKDQPLYAFQAYDTLDGESEVLTRIEDIASNYLEAMQTVQPQGPYFLGGHSFGGRVAFEIARQLHQQQQEIGLLVIIDDYAPMPKETSSSLFSYYNEWGDARWLMEVVESVEIAVSSAIDVTYEQLQKLTWSEQLEQILQQFKIVNALPPNSQIKHLQQMMEVYKSNLMAATIYSPPQETFPFPIALLRSKEILSEELEETPDFQIYYQLAQESTLGWNRFSSQPVEVHFVPGEHASMMVEPNLKVLAKQLKNCLESAQTICQ